MNHSKLNKARAALIIDQPFFASILLPMPISEGSDTHTMETDGASILFNKEWTDKLTLDETIFVLAHETLHCVFDHMGRRGTRGPNRWNQAADYIINKILIDDRVGSMPHGGLHNPSLVAQGNGTADGVYNLLPEEDENKQAGTPGGALDHVNDAGTENGTAPTDQAKMNQASADIKVRVIAAKNAAKMQGKLSAGMARLVDDLCTPVVDWKTELRKYLSEKAKTEYTYARPKRRFLAEDYYLPSLSGDRMGPLVIAIDCSGSTWSEPKLLDSFAAEINAIREDLKPSALDVVYFDSKVCKIDPVDPDSEIVITPMGGGGTAFSPVIEYVNSKEMAPACTIFLTDLQCDDYGPKPEYPVLWVALGKLDPYYSKRVPYGDILEVSNE